MLKRILLASLALAVGASGHITPNPNSTLKVHHGAGVNGYDVNSTMISGEKDMLVIDPQFSLSEAHRLAAEILESKKNLTLDLRHASPPRSSVRARGAAPGVPERQDRRAAGDRQRRENRLARSAEVLVPDLRKQHPRARARSSRGTHDACTRRWKASNSRSPAACKGDGPGNSFVYIPSLKAVVAGDTVFDRVYFGVPKRQGPGRRG